MKQERQTKQQQTNKAPSQPLHPIPRSLLASKSLSFPEWFNVVLLLVILFILTNAFSSCSSVFSSSNPSATPTSNPSLALSLLPASVYTARIPGSDCDQNSNPSGVS